jgi:hypothetical protein
MILAFLIALAYATLMILTEIREWTRILERKIANA